MKTTLKILLLSIISGCTAACVQNKSNQEPVQSTTITVNGESFDMILVEGGTFIMGCTDEQGCDCEDNEKPAHKETVADFYIGKYEVTQKLWNAVMDSDFVRSSNFNCDDCPVEGVSWKDAQKFITKLNALTDSTFRLPTEAEWEYAARGGNRSKGYKYSGSNDVGEVAWYIENYEESKYGEKGTTHPVGLKKPNELGIYDMSGNVWEWCNDIYTKEYYNNGKVVSPEWPYEGLPRFFRYILRGGSWGGTAKGCRVSYIDYDIPGYSDEYGGFRIVLDSKAKGTTQK